VVIPLVVGIDGSESSLQAVDWAADEAARHRLPLRLVHAAATLEHETTDSIIASATARASKRAPAVDRASEVLYEEPVAALTGKGRNAYALVLGSRGLGDLAGLLLGSVSLAVAGRADCPVVVVRGGPEHRNTHFGKVIVGIEEGEGSGTAARFACREAHTRHSTLVAVHAWHAPISAPSPSRPGYGPEAGRRPPAQVLDEALHDLEQEYPQITMDRRAVQGPPPRALLEAAAGADLLVVGARRRRGHFGLQLGLVNHCMLHHAPCPVAVVPQI
jgi:nucleotide-binding universal stress UspA family protein